MIYSNSTYIESNNTNSNNQRTASTQPTPRKEAVMAYHLSEMLAPNKEFMLMSSDVAIGMALSQLVMSIRRCM
jgi:hypothetical protein